MYKKIFRGVGAVIIIISLFSSTSVFGQTGSTTPDTPKKLTGACSVRVRGASSVNDDFRIYWNTRIKGSGDKTYSWSGTDGLTGSSPAVNHLYTTQGLKEGSVSVSSGNEDFTLTCNALVQKSTSATSTELLGGSCNPSVTGMTVTWGTTINDNSTSTISYTWSGTDGLTGSSTSSFTRKVYDTPGIKTARVTIGSGTESITLECQAKVEQGSGGDGSCFIATAAYGTESEPEVVALRNFRDEKLLQHKMGEMFVEGYYKVSPPIADFIRDKEPLKAAVRGALKPVVWGIEKMED